jgi:hypothetical protein
MKLDSSSDTLYIRISQKEFVFARYDHLRPQTLNYVVYKLQPNISLNANMHEAIRRISLTRGDFSYVRVLVEGAATLVPLNDFDEDDAESFYFFNLPEKQKWRRVCYDTLPHLNAVLLFSVDKDVCHTLEESFQNLFVQSSETPLLLHFAQCSPASLKQGRIFANLTDGRMSVMGFRKGKLGLYNSFALHHDDDAAYYLLRTVKGWSFNIETDELFLKGEVGLTQKLCTEVKPYISHVEVIDTSEEFNTHVATLQDCLPFDLIVLLLRAF